MAAEKPVNSLKSTLQLKPKCGKACWILLTVIITLIVAGAGAYAWQKSISNIDNQTINQLQQQSTNLTAQLNKLSDKIAVQNNNQVNQNQQTNDITELGFTFNYPKDWPMPVYIKESKPVDISKKEFYSNFSNNFGATTYQGVINLGALMGKPGEEGHGYKYYMQILNPVDYTTALSNIKKVAAVTEINETTVKNIKVISYNEAGMCAFRNMLVFLPNNTVLFNGICGAGDNDVIKQMQAIVESIKISDGGLAMIIKNLFAVKYNKTTDNITLTIDRHEGNFVKGSVKLVPEGTPGEGGIYFATIGADGNWKIVSDGNGIVKCQVLRDNNFPASWLQNNCLDY